MTEHAHAATFATHSLGWSTFFAQETQESDQDLEFDEGLEDDDLNQHKPPTRRPLLWILLLLIVVGVVYWTMKPDLAQLPDLSSPMATTIDATPSSSEVSESSHQDTALATVPNPEFGEGDEVVLSPQNSKESQSLHLTHDSGGLKPGPKVQTGDLLIIMDGETIGKQWVYHVRTLSGEKGWIAGGLLQKKI